jgi:hypothetical protein
MTDNALMADVANRWRDGLEGDVLLGQDLAEPLSRDGDLLALLVAR